MVKLCVLLLLLVYISLRSCQATTAVCPTPLTINVIDSTPGVTLPGGSYGLDIVSVGPYVMVIYNTPSASYTSFSFDNGATFPSSTKSLMLPYPSNVANMDLVTDGQSVIAVGTYGSQMFNMRYSFSELKWFNGSRIYPTLVSFVNCAAKPQLYICTVANDATPVSNGMEIFTLSTSNLSTEVWVQRTANNLPIMQAPGSVASDGNTVMVCGIGSLNAVNQIVCALSIDGIASYENTNSPFDVTGFPSNSEIRVASNGVNGSYIIAFVHSGTILTRYTLDGGNSWLSGGVLFPFSSTIPVSIQFTNLYVSFSSTSSLSYGISRQNGSNPIQFGPQVDLINGTLASFASANFGPNYYLTYKDSSNRIIVASCIPTAGPTVAPSPSPSKSSSNKLKGTIHCLIALTILVFFY